MMKLGTLYQKITLCFQLLCILAFSQMGFAQQKTNNYEIKTSVGNFELKAFQTTDFQPLTGDRFDNHYFRLVQFYELPSDNQRKNWESQGMVLTDYLAANTYFAVIGQQFPIAQLQQSVRAIAPVEAAIKKEASLFFKGIPEHAKKANNQAQLILSYYKSLNPNAVIADLKSKGVQVLEHRDYSNQLDVLIEATQLDAVTNLPYVQFVGASSETPVNETLDYRNTTSRANFLNTGYNGLNYAGQGVVIGIGEGDTLGNEIDFKGRFSEVGSSGVPGSHKIPVTQNAAGAGNLDPNDKNNAWGATILSLPGGPNYSSLYTTHNLRYTNHSYGFDISGGYDSSARNHDLRIAALPNHLVSYSCGNSGTDIGYAPYNFANWANITGQAKQNKNQIAVGALSAEDVITGFSSRGPMYDGRIIPQLVVEGGGGTSFASPKVVGDFAILAQVYKDKNAGAEPTSSLLRAVIMDTADDLGNPGPDYIHGFGRPNLRRAYNVINANQMITSSIANGGTNNHTVVVPTNTKQIRVMIVWPDVTAAVNANPAIVNNLNLTLTSPSATAFNPWILDSTPNVANLNMPATRGVDSINTMEQVTVDNPDAGSWTVSVNGFSVPSGPQTYYLVYEFLADELQITYPLQNQKFVSGEEYFLRWDSYGSTDTFNLAYELNNSGNWVAIANGYDANSRVYRWNAPTVSGGINAIKFRVQRGALSSVSAVNQIGALPDNFRIAKVCSDVVTLKWSPVADATSYKVYRLGAQYMEEVTTNITYSGSSAVLTGQSTSSSEYYAVSAVTNTTEGQRTIAIEKVAGDANCTGISWTGTVSTNWFTPGNWSSGAIPTATDNVEIQSSATFQPSIAAAGAVCATITINTGASLSMSAATAYTLSVSNDWINNGTFTSGIGTVDFVNTGAYQEISGDSTTNFYFLKVTKGTQDIVLEANAMITLNAPANPLNLVSGTFKLSSNSTITPFTSTASLSNLNGIWNNGGTITFGNFSWFLNTGLLRTSAGITNVGGASGNSITYLNNGQLIVEGGALNIAGRFSPNSGTSSCTVKVTGGTLTVNRFGSTSTTRAPFEMTGNANFTFTGGTIVIQRASSNTADYINLANTNVVSGGTLQIGNASTPVSQVIRINSIVPIYNLTVNAFNAPTARLVTNHLTIKNDLLVAGGTFDANAFDTTIQGNWINNGTFIPNVGKVVFNGAVNQKIEGSNATTFKGLTLNNSLGLTLNSSVNASVDGQLNLTNGVLTTASNKLIITANGSVLRTTGHIFGNLQKAFSAGSLSKTFEIGDEVVANYTPVTVSFASIGTAGNVTVTTKEGDHPNIASSSLIQNKSVNRYWNLQNSGVIFSNYNAIFNFLSTDKDVAATAANLKAGTYTSTWNYPTTGTANSTSTEVTGVTTFGDFQLAENCVDTSSTQKVSACTSYTWTANNQTYTESGSYEYISLSPSGCTDTKTLVLTILQNVMPTFTPVAPICSGASLSALPTTANNGIIGTWAPALDNTTTTIYTFTPNIGQCASTTTMTITVVPQLIWYLDADGDHYYTGTAVSSCTSPGAGYTTTVTGDGDCDDAVAFINPGVVEVCFNNIDDNCTSTLSEGCLPVVVNMTPSFNNSTLVSLATAIPAVAYSFGGFTNIKYRFSITNTTTGVTAPDIIQTSRYVTIPAAIHTHGASYTITASAVINEEIVPFAGNTITVNSPAVPLITLSSSSCGATLATLASTLTANPGLNATGYTFRIRLNDSNSSPTYGFSPSATRFVGANTFTGFPLQYGSSYRVAVQYTFTDPVSSLPVDSGYGAECVVNTPSIPVTSMASPSCGGTVSALNANMAARAASYATGYRFRIRLFSDNGPTPTYYETAVQPSRFSSLTAFQGFTIAYSTEYAISVQYSVLNGSTTEWSAFGPDCKVTTPFFPTTSLVPSQCGLPNATSLTQQLNITPYPGFPNYKVLLEEIDGETVVTSEEREIVYSNFKLSDFAIAQLGKNYNVSVAIKLNGVFGDYSTACDLFTEEAAPSKAMVQTPFTATAYPNPFANNFMLDVKTSSQSSVNVKVYDMVGRLIEQKEVSVSDMESTTIGNQYPSGVYNVIVAQEDTIQTVRVVKR